MRLRTVFLTLAVLCAAVFVGASDRALSSIGPVNVQAQLVEHAPVPWGQRDVIGSYWLFGQLSADADHALIEWRVRTDPDRWRTSWPYGLSRTLHFVWEDTFDAYVAYVPRPDLPGSMHQVAVLEIDADAGVATLKEGVVATVGHYPWWEWSPDHYWQVHELGPQTFSPRMHGGSRRPGE